MPIETSRKIHTEEFEIILVLEGTVHQYVPNVWENLQKNWELHVLKRELLLFRRIKKNQFYTSYHPKYAHNQSQLLVEAGSVLAKIPDHIFMKYFEKKL